MKRQDLTFCLNFVYEEGIAYTDICTIPIDFLAFYTHSAKTTGVLSVCLRAYVNGTFSINLLCYHMLKF